MAYFRNGLTRDPPGFNVLHVTGPGGIGKSTVLHLFSRLAQELGIPVVEVDGRDIEPTAPGLTQACVDEAGAETLDAWIEQLAARKSVLFIDAFDALQSLDQWVRSQFLPLLPSDTRVVIAGRYRPSPAWLSDPGLAGLVHVLNIRNLGRKESRELLRRRGVPDREHGAILDFTHGHPLALSLVAELYQHEAPLRFRPTPTVVHTLVEALMDSVVDDERRLAIELSALVRAVTEELLEETVAPDSAASVFEWLAQRSFMEAHVRGIAPHDLARDAVAADLKWRNPHRFTSLHDQARSYYRSLLATHPREQALTLMDYVYLHRESPFVRPFIDFSGGEEAHLDVLHPEDHATILECVQRFEGPVSADIHRRWLEILPSAVRVVRSMAGVISGFWMEIDIDDLSELDVSFDPLVFKIGATTSGHLRPDERAILFRTWMDVNSYQAISPVQSRLFIEFVRRYLGTPRLVQTYVVCADPVFWEPLFTYADMPRYPGLEGAKVGHTYGVYGHDWRARPPMAWLDLLAEREVAEEPDFTESMPSIDLVVLSEGDFRSAVFDALRNYQRPAALATNPLLRSSLITRWPEANAPVEILKNLLFAEVEAMKTAPETERLYATMYHGFIHPAPTHEAAARLAHVSYSTFRRYVAKGRDLIADRLWQMEIDPTRS